MKLFMIKISKKAPPSFGYYNRNTNCFCFYFDLLLLLLWPYWIAAVKLKPWSFTQYIVW